MVMDAGVEAGSSVVETGRTLAGFELLVSSFGTSIKNRNRASKNGTIDNTA